MAGPLIRRALPLAAALALGFAVGQVSGAVRAADGPYAALDIFARVLTQISESYVDPTNQRDLVYRALDGMDDALDAHSRFLDPDSLRRLRDESEGQFVGIGAQLRGAPCGLEVTGVLAGGPSQRAGIAAGDCLVSVDGKPLAGMELEAALALVRGQEGEAVTLGVAREGATRPVPVLRSRLIEATVEGDLLAPGLAWVRVRQFRTGAAADLSAKVAELGANTPVIGLLLDMRENPGGRLDEAVAMADLFLHDGRIVSTRGRLAQPDEAYDATPSKTDWDFPVFVLVDGGSASAAEIVAGALQDRGRARLVGAPTYGKGSVQSLFEYEDGSALKLTIARYYLPSGRRIEDHRGLTPDILVATPTAPGPASLLREQLTNNTSLSEAERAELLAIADRLPADRVAESIVRDGPIKSRITRDPTLAAGYAALVAAVRR